MTPGTREHDLHARGPRLAWALAGLGGLIVLAAALLPVGVAHEVPTIQLDVTAHDNDVACLEEGDCWFEIVKDGEALSGDNPDLPLERGATVEVSFENGGSMDHSFEIGVDPYGDGDYGGTDTIEPGGTDGFTFEVPWDAPSDGTYWCFPHSSVMEGTPVFEGDNTAPELVVDDPSPGETVEGVVAIAGTTQDAEADPVTVEVQAPPAEGWQPADGSDDWSHAWNSTQVDNGDHTLRVRATDPHGFETVVERTVTVDNPLPPTVGIDRPLPGAQVSGNVTVEGTATDADGDLDRVEVKLPSDDAWRPADGLTEWSIDWNTTGLAPGPRTVWARAVDGEGLTARANVTVEIVAPGRPRVTVTSPLDGATVEGTVQVNGTAEDPEGELSRVEVRVDDGPWQAANGTTTWNATVEVAPGDHGISARAIAGDRMSPPVTVNVTVPTSDDDGDDSDSSSGADGSIEAPGNVTVSASDRGFAVQWDPVDGATAYRVQRDTGDGFETIARTTGTRYDDGRVPSGVAPAYRVVAVGPDATAASEPVPTGDQRGPALLLPLWLTVAGWLVASAVAGRRTAT